MNAETQAGPTFVSIGILAYSNEDTVATTLTSLFKQSLFGRLARSNLTCEIICVMNEQMVGMISAVEAVLQTQVNTHEHPGTFVCHIVRIPERTRSDAWNAFVHSSSESSSKFLFVIDGDVVVHDHEGMWNLLCALNDKPDTSVAVGEPVNDLAFNPVKTRRDRISLAMSHLALAGDVVIPEQLYCIRAEVARKIYLPRDLPMEGRFLVAVVGTDFLKKETNPRRILRLPDKTHIFRAPASVGESLSVRKRRMIARTVTHVLVDHYLSKFNEPSKDRMGVIMMDNDATRPAWLRKLVDQHLQGCHFFWKLFPDALTFRLLRLKKLSEMEEVRYMPVAVLDQLGAWVGCWKAYRTLKSEYKRRSQALTVVAPPITPGPSENGEVEKAHVLSPVLLRH